jgi:hypothetical protein
VQTIAGYQYHSGEKIMSKSQDKKKDDKTKPAKTPKEKKQAKKEKKDQKETPGLLDKK